MHVLMHLLECYPPCSMCTCGSMHVRSSAPSAAALLSCTGALAPASCSIPCKCPVHVGWGMVCCALQAETDSTLSAWPLGCSVARLLSRCA